VETASSQLGVMCLTLCRRCASFDDIVPVAVSTAARLVLQHCEHFGITANDMPTILNTDHGDDR
jgi:hypothetical protein